MRLWVSLCLLIAFTDTLAEKTKACDGEDCSPSLKTPYIVNDISSASNPSLVKPVILDSSQQRVGLHFQTSDVVGPTRPGALPASQYYEPLHDDAGNPIKLNDPPTLPKLHGKDMSLDTTEVEDQDILDAIAGTYTVPPTQSAASFAAEIKKQADAELAADDARQGGEGSTGGGAGASSAILPGDGDAATDTAVLAAEASPATSVANMHIPDEATIDAQLKALDGVGDPRLHSLESVEQTAKAQAAVMKRAESILKLLDKAYGELGSKLAAVSAQRNALRHQYLSTRQYLHALHLHALKLLKQDSELGYDPADLTNTPAAQFLNGLPTSAGSLNAAAILSKIQELLLAASGNAPATAATNTQPGGCCGNDPISRELQALINGAGGGSVTTTPATGDESSTGYFEPVDVSSSSTGDDTIPPVSSTAADTGIDASTAEESTGSPEPSSTGPEASSTGLEGFLQIDDAAFARVQEEAREEEAALLAKHNALKQNHPKSKHTHKRAHQGENEMLSEASVKETTKSTLKTDATTDLDDPKQWVSHFGQMSVKDAQTVSSVGHLPDPDHITIKDLPLLEAAIKGEASTNTKPASEDLSLPSLPALSGNVPSAASLLETSTQVHSTRNLQSTTKGDDPSAAELLKMLRAKMKTTKSLMNDIAALKHQSETMDTDPAQKAAMNKELAALQRGEKVFTTSDPIPSVAPVLAAHSSPSDMLGILRGLKEPAAATVHATDSNFPSFDELGLLETKELTAHKRHLQQHQATPQSSSKFAMPNFPQEPSFDSPESVDIVAAAMATEAAPHKKHHHALAAKPDRVHAALLQLDSTLKTKQKEQTGRNFKAEIAHQEHVLDHLHNKYAHTQYTDTLREVLGDPVVSASENFPTISQTVAGAHHPRVVQSIQQDLDRNANNMYQDVMAAAEGGDGEDALFDSSSVPMTLPQFREQKRDQERQGISVTPDVVASNARDKYVFPELDIPTLNLKTVQTPSAQLAAVMARGTDSNNVDALIQAYHHSADAINNPDADEESNWDELERLRQHTHVSKSVKTLIDQAQAAMSGVPSKHHFNSGGLEGALSLIDEGLSVPVHEPEMSEDEAYRKVLHVTSGVPSTSTNHKTTPHKTPKKRATTHESHQPNFLQSHSSTHASKDKKHKDLKDGKELTVEQLQKLARKHIKEGDKVVRHLQDFQEKMVPEFKKSDHNLVHEPITHHHHHQQSLLEVSEGQHNEKQKSTNKHKTEAVFAAAAKAAEESAEDDVDLLLQQANSDITKDKGLVQELGSVHSKLNSIQHEYAAIRKSDAADIAAMAVEDSLLGKEHSSEKELNLLEGGSAQRKKKIGGGSAHRMRAKIQKHRRPGHS